MTKTALFLFILFSIRPSYAKSPQQEIDAALGLWNTQDHDGVIELYNCDQKLCGRFYWIEAEKDGSISRDTKNPDKDLRNRPLCGMQFIGNFSPEGKGRFGSGWIYSPRHGSLFSAELRLKDANTLVLRGYFLIPMLGENQIWTRAPNAQKCEIE